MTPRPLIAHVLYRLDTGGMERVMVSLIKATRGRYRHAVITLAGFGELRSEIEDDVDAFISLDKRPGKDWPCYMRFWRALQQLRPDIVQSYNIGALDLAPIARLAGARVLVHAEHGRDAADPEGNNTKYRRLRRWMAPFINRYVAVSPELATWLTERVNIATDKVAYITNGIDTAAFHVPRPRVGPRRLLREFVPEDSMLIVNVARLDRVKDHACLLEAFRDLRDMIGTLVDCRLAIAGDGPERDALARQIETLGLSDYVRLLGNLDDVATLLADADLFVLSSIAEGIPLTVLEAMAASLPVVVTDVGGLAEVVVEGTTGTLVTASDPSALANAMIGYARDPALRHRHGATGRARADAHFGLDTMVAAYGQLYDALLAEHQTTKAQRHPTPQASRRGEH